MDPHSQPLVSVVTPCYNMAGYLEETIQSVLSQDYPRIEYIVMDGGSSDGTVELLEKYGQRIKYRSQPDLGQAHAINRGFLMSTGEIIAYLNADDTYHPGAISAVVRHFQDHPEVAVVYGEAHYVGRNGELIGPYPTLPFDRSRLAEHCFICQPAAFLRRSALESAGMMNQGLHYALDYDLWIRMAKRFPFLKIDEVLANSRMHPATKTLGRRRRVFLENMSVLKTHYGYVPFDWVYAYSCHLVDGKDQFFEMPRPSASKAALAFLLGSWHNRGQLIRFWREGLGKVVRYLRTGSAQLC